MTSSTAIFPHCILRSAIILGLFVLSLPIELSAQKINIKVADEGITRGVIRVRRPTSAQNLYGRWELRYLARDTDSRKKRVNPRKADEKGQVLKAYDFEKDLSYTFYSSEKSPVPANASLNDSIVPLFPAFQRDDIPVLEVNIESSMFPTEERGNWNIQNQGDSVTLKTRKTARVLKAPNEEIPASEAEVENPLNETPILFQDEDQLVILGDQMGEPMVEYYYRPKPKVLKNEFWAGGGNKFKRPLHGRKFRLGR